MTAVGAELGATRATPRGWQAGEQHETPRAWTDELIAIWVVERIKAEWGQAIWQVDCLGAQWSELVLLDAWLQGIPWCPLTLDVTSYSQEPGTHRHSQLKSIIREVKSELHFQLEQETRNKARH